LVAILWILFLSVPAFAGESELAGKFNQLRRSWTDPEEVRLAAVLETSLMAYDAVSDYRAIFRKQEETEGELGGQETIFLKFEKPFKIFMGWLDTHKKGLQVLYERGRHDGKLAIHKPGLLLGLAPVVFLDRNSPWVREGSESYDIEDAGIGTFLVDFSKMVLKGSQEKTIRVQVSENPEGQTVDVAFPGTTPGSGYFAYRVVAFFDGTNHLPVQMSLYDWKEKLVGIYAYQNLLLNIGMDDPEFKKEAERRLYRFFMPPSTRPAKTQNFSTR
jgi:hypothetical protein